MGTGLGQNCTKTKLHEGTKLHRGTKLHEDKIARRVKFARRSFCTKTNLHEGTKLHKDKFARGVKFARALTEKNLKETIVAHQKERERFFNEFNLLKNEKEMELSEKDKKVQEISTVLRNHEAESKNLKKENE